MVRIGYNMNLRQLKKADDALIGMGILGVILIFVVAVVVILALISLVFGIFTLIGMALLVAAAFILFMKKGAVTIAPTSVFMWLLVIGIFLVFFGQVVMDIGSVDLSTIPGLEALHNLVRVNGGGEI